MKKTFKQISGSAAAVAVLASGALLVSVTDSVAQQRSPTGEPWDCLIDGAQGRGVAYVTFHDDFGVSGVSVIRPNRVVQTSSPNDDDVDPRTDGGETGRGGDTSSTPAPTVSYNRNIYGFGPIDGQWRYDERGNVVGYFTQVISSGGTNAATTNMIGFRAIVVPSVRLTMTAFVPGGGRSVFRGIKLREMPDLSGPWYGAQINRTERLYEFFDAAPSEQSGAYTVTGNGAVYNTAGWLIFSSRNRIGMALRCGDNIRATVGTFNRRSRMALTTGILQPGEAVRFNAYHYPPVVAPPPPAL